MTKFLSKLLATAVMFLFLAGSVYASDLSVRLEQPKTPTTLSSFKITFVALDVQDRAVTVKCFKKAPGDASFSQYGSDISLPAGGDTGTCEVTSAILNQDGNFDFYVSAQANGDTEQSSIVTLKRQTSSPGTPQSYSKEKLASGCEYKISFKTADDNGETSKVEIYRSDQTSFNADSGTRVGTVSIGSNQEGSFTNSVPDCGKTWYFAIRAFNGVGNGSGVTGDSETVVVTKIAETSQQAIPVTESQVSQGSILGQAISEGGEGQTLGEATKEAQEEITPLPSSEPTGAGGLLTGRNFFLALLVIIILGGIYFYRKSRV
ncbi:hypothetical protein HY387_01185 [Candidatus Daviesbacteria bacterium]|nr:hypothetical protein [Candidatus Daviesbacteria bacterium]